jgi:hypothetical protein
MDEDDIFFRSPESSSLTPTTSLQFSPTLMPRKHSLMPPTPPTTSTLLIQPVLARTLPPSDAAFTFAVTHAVTITYVVNPPTPVSSNHTSATTFTSTSEATRTNPTNPEARWILCHRYKKNTRWCHNQLSRFHE